jgi:hypothetical protein
VNYQERLISILRELHMTIKSSKLVLALTSAAILTMAGCGGSDSGGTVAGGGGSTVIISASTLKGTAATGAALANATVLITDSTSILPCEEVSITTTALGSYTCTLKSGKTAPFFVVVIDPTGNTAPMMSVQVTTPAAGESLTVNATPLTTAILAQLAPDGNPFTLINSKVVDGAALQKVTANVVAQLANVLTAIGAPAGYNPFTTSITAATVTGTGNTADLVLDVIKIAINPSTGNLALTTVDNPVPVELATATTTGVAMPQPTAGVSTLSQAAQIAAKAFTACFAVPTAQRVLSKDTGVPASLGGPEINDVAPACLEIVADTGNAAKIDFLHNGYNAGQLLYGLMTDNKMTNATFSVPEIMAFYTADSTASAPSAAAYDQAVLNIKYLDNEGNPGSVITVARNIPNTTSATRPTNWWLVGNQQPVDIGARLNIRRVEQRNAANTNTNKISTFQTGMAFTVNAKGPGSIRAEGSLTFARISGPGLPGNGAAGTGLVYKTSTGQQASMDLFNKTGSLAVGAQCGNGTTFNCPNLWFARTKGITGTDATTLATNQSSLLWAQTGDNMEPAKVVKGARYKVELFYGTNTTTPGVVLHKTLLTDLVQATQAVNLPWNTLGAKSVAALDPAGSLTGAQTALPVDWLQNVSAQQIGGVQSVIDTTSGGFGPTKGVPKGATSAVLDNQTVPVFVTTSNVGRTLLFSYRMVDSSNKTAVYTYN